MTLVKGFLDWFLPLVWANFMLFAISLVSLVALPIVRANTEIVNFSVSEALGRAIPFTRPWYPTKSMVLPFSDVILHIGQPWAPIITNANGSYLRQLLGRLWNKSAIPRVRGTAHSNLAAPVPMSGGLRWSWLKTGVVSQNSPCDFHGLLLYVHVNPPLKSP